jgi:hypothetical protein
MHNKKQRKYLKKISKKYQRRTIITDKNSDINNEEINIIIALTDYVEKHNGDAFYHVGFGVRNEKEGTVNIKSSGYGEPEWVEKSIEMFTKNFNRLNRK